MQTVFSSRFSVFFAAGVLCAVLLSGCAPAPQQKNTDDVAGEGTASSNATASIQVLGPNGEMETIDNAQVLENGTILENVSANNRDQHAADAQRGGEESPAPGLISFAPLNATFEEYTRSRYDMVKGNKPFVLFFSGSGLVFGDECVNCPTVDSIIESDLKNFPEGTYILRADFSRDNAIKQEYKVLKIGTVLVFDASGNVIYTNTILSSMEELDDLKAAIRKSLGV